MWRCPYCNRELNISEKVESGMYPCPYEDCSETFFFDRKTNTVNKVEVKKSLDDISGLLVEFDKALDDEIKAVKTRGGDKTLVLKEGKFIGEIDEGKVYQFNLERRIPVADETPAQIEIRGKSYRASIVRFLEFKLQVRITQDFDGEQIPFALLKIDAT